MKNINLGFIGLGFVGGAAHNIFKEYFHTKIYDLDSKKCNVSSIEELATKCKIIFIAIPTPSIPETGKYNIQALDAICNKLNNFNINNIIVLKSSVEPGTTSYLSNTYKNIKFVFNPEFLRENTANEDFANQDRIILGSNDMEAMIEVEKIYKTAFPNVDVHKTGPTEAEMVKFFTNIYLATKVSLCNEIYTICEKLNINYNTVRDLTVLDKRINKSHTNVPGESNSICSSGRGFGKKCFPANLNILINKAKELGTSPIIMEAVRKRNNTIDRPEKDWDSKETTQDLISSEISAASKEEAFELKKELEKEFNDYIFIPDNACGFFKRYSFIVKKADGTALSVEELKELDLNRIYLWKIKKGFNK